RGRRRPEQQPYHRPAVERNVVMRLLALRRPRRRRGGPRSRDEIETERRRQLEEVWLEIDALLAEAHAKLPRRRAKGFGCIYARFSTRFQHSIADQVRACLEVAV